MSAYTEATPQQRHDMAVNGQDDFSRALRGQQPMTQAEMDQFFKTLELAKVIGDDFMMVIVNHPDLQLPENKPRIHVQYAGLWDGPVQTNALKIYNLVWTRQMAVWDHVKNVPGEHIKTSINDEQYNSWENSGAYIANTLYPATPAGYAKGEVGYRPKPDEPGYYGRYTTQTHGAR